MKEPPSGLLPPFLWLVLSVKALLPKQSEAVSARDGQENCEGHVTSVRQVLPAAQKQVGLTRRGNIGFQKVVRNVRKNRSGKVQVAITKSIEINIIQL